MLRKRRKITFTLLLMLFIFDSSITSKLNAQSVTIGNPGNFGLPGVIDLPTARRFAVGELIATQQLHNSLARSGIAFQALPRASVAFRYSGHGVGGTEAYGRINHDRSFDLHISVFDEKKYLPEISIGLRDFIGTGWYSSEYIVGTKSVGNLEITAGLGFGRLAGRNLMSNPLGKFSSRFSKRDKNNFGMGGTLGTINWFQGDTSAFYGIRYQLNEKLALLTEYTADLMLREKSYIDIASPWSFGTSYKLNKYVDISAQYLSGSQVSLTANVIVNPDRPPLLGGKELAPVPMRIRGENYTSLPQIDQHMIRKVLSADRFQIKHLKINGDTVSISVRNTKFRSTAQAVGRVASALQRFTSDSIKFAKISFDNGDLQTASYLIDLKEITEQQFNPVTTKNVSSSIKAIEVQALRGEDTQNPFLWGLGPYIEHRLFDPDLPLAMETGIELSTGYKLSPGLKLSGTFRKSVLTNLTDITRRSDSVLPHVHSDWPVYDAAGQSGHIYDLKLSYIKNLAPGIYGRAQAGLLEPFFAGFGGEILYKPAQFPVAFGIDVHRVRQRDYDMQFSLRSYETTTGHLSVYYDAGGIFDIEINAGRYLAGDWGMTTTIARKFGSGWEVGGYATLTDVPFETFGEGSFDKAIYLSIPIDWIISSPDRTRRRLTLRPITRDGGANLSSARNLYSRIEETQNASFQREFGRLWK